LRGERENEQWLRRERKVCKRGEREKAMAKERERPLKKGRRHAHPKTFCNREERERE
jgi:hypothetical protein